MKYTNTHDLPKAVVEALIGDDFDLSKVPANIFWATRLINSPKIAQLEVRHWGEIEADVSEKFSRVLGSALHEYLQAKSNDANRLSEEKAYIDTTSWAVRTLPLNGTLKTQPWYDADVIYVSCRLDSYEEVDGRGIVDDYKTGKVWTAIDGVPKPDWVTQNNIYAYCLRKIGFKVDEIRNTYFITDWAKTKVATDHRYPKIPIVLFSNQPIWPDNQVVAYLESRIKAHVAAMSLDDDHIPECTCVERWTKPTVYAVMKVGRKTSIKNYYGEDEKGLAENYAASLGTNHYVEKRPGSNPRCESYCSVSRWCHFYKANVGASSQGSEE